MLKDYRIRRDVMKYHRTLQHMSQQRLAERAGLSLGQVSRIESGRIETPHFPTIEKLATALGIEEDELIELLLEEPSR
jgi:transcriptional regulator with XRE-family HTH domain